jgi:hypothetical protein
MTSTISAIASSDSLIAAFVVVAVVMGLSEVIARVVTGATIGAFAPVIALSVAVGITKAIACMLLTPLVARTIGLTDSRAAMIYGGLLDMTSGVATGLDAVYTRLVPYGAMTATFYTGLHRARMSCGAFPGACRFSAPPAMNLPSSMLAPGSNRSAGGYPA